MSLSVGGSTITVRVSSAAPDSASPVWVDISDRVHLPKGTSLQTWIGWQTSMASTETGKADWTLLNNDDAFTTGNTSSPYFPWWKQSRRAQIIETVLGKEFVLADVYLEIPTTNIAVQPTDGSIAFVTVKVTAVDVLARLRGGRKLKSSLSEHILWEGRDELAGYWPLTDPAPPYLGVGPVRDPITVTKGINGTTPPTEDAQPQAGLAPPGSEGQGIRCATSTVNLGAGYGYVSLGLPAGVTIPVGDAETLTIAGWYALGPVNPLLSHQILNFVVSGSGSVSISVDRDTTTGIWSLNADLAMTGTVAFGAVGAESLVPVAVTFSSAAQSMELWVGRQRVTATLAGGPITGMTLSAVTWGFQLDYDLSHWQIYTGTQWGRDQFLEQIQQAYAPLDRQTTGERVNRILDYAGFPALRRHVGRGVALMSQTTLAGKTPNQALEEAVQTERGRLFAAAGDIHFHDRVHVYNV